MEHMDSLHVAVLRLCDYDPVKADEIMEGSTLTEVAKAVTLSRHDNEIEYD